MRFNSIMHNFVVRFVGTVAPDRPLRVKTALFQTTEGGRPYNRFMQIAGMRVIIR